MPSYFFHLKLELYKEPAASKRNLADLTTRHNPHVPQAGSDIFKTALPAHQTSKWASYQFLNRPDTPHSLSTSGSESPHRYPHNEHSESRGDALLLPERIPNKKEIPKPAAVIPAKPTNEAAARDWRYDSVSIESIDMEGIAPKSGLHTKATYIPSDPKTTEVGWGVVHLYRDTEEASTRHTGLEKLGSTESFDLDDCSTLCMLAVPSWMMPADLLGFVGEQAREDVSHFRLIRTERTNKYMVLMKFRSAKKAREWQKANNGRLFSTVEPENCHVVFVKSVEFVSSEDSEPGQSNGNFPQNNHDSFTSTHRNGYTSRPETKLSSKPPAPPPPNLLELPTCPVCLERMDETTGLLTILCQHVFHCACLEKWRFTGSGCPVCRYTQSPSYTFPYPRPSHDGTDYGHEDEEPMCSVCAKTKSESATIWICLICGNLGCGRYDAAHAYAHYEETSHCYAMDISTQRVWDYAGDGYVHRLIQNKSQEISQPQQNGSKSTISERDTRPRHENEAYRAEGGDMVPREKMESMATEYTYLLTSQLEGQRKYFEEQFERAVGKADKASAQAEAAALQAQKAVADMEASTAERDSMQEANQRLEKSLEKAQKTKVASESLARKLQTELREERTVIEGLMKRIAAADEKAEQAKAQAEKAEEQIKDLEDQNRDLALFISGSQKVKELQAQGEEVVDGSASVPDAPKKRGRGRKK